MSLSLSVHTCCVMDLAWISWPIFPDMVHVSGNTQKGIYISSHQLAIIECNCQIGMVVIGLTIMSKEHTLFCFSYWNPYKFSVRTDFLLRSNSFVPLIVRGCHFPGSSSTCMWQGGERERERMLWSRVVEHHLVPDVCNYLR